MSAVKQAAPERQGKVMGRLTTHILDTANGCPAQGVSVHLYRLVEDGREKLVSATTNDDGRCDAPLLADADFTKGQYELVFEVGAYFATRGVKSEVAFLDSVPVRFGVDDVGAHYHVPLLISPFGYSTYRGS